MGLWWVQEGWTETRCSQCGVKIWPEGDPDWGLCFNCWNNRWQAQEQYPEPIEAEDELKRMTIEQLRIIVEVKQ